MRAHRRSRSHHTAALVAWNLLPAILAPALVACGIEERALGPVRGVADAGSTSPAPESPALADPEGTPGESTVVESLNPGAAIDENSCVVDAGACAPEAAAGEGALDCPGCLVEGECIGADAVDEANPCLVCDPERDPLGWSPNDGAPCDDESFCTTDDVCAAGACAGAQRSCDDGVACNGVSTCDEESESCTRDVNGCGAGFVCDVASDTCVTTCTGCLVDGVCIPAGSEATGNSCLVCNPTLSTTAFSVAVGEACGSGASVCSAQDTCDAQGACQPNHLPAGAACGSSSSSACDQADTCDGAGRCLQRLSANGAPCDDGAFCTVGDQCQGGQCVSGGNRNCGANQLCNENQNQCQCAGCSIAGACVPSGTANPANPCQVCDPSRSATSYSSSVGAVCGAPATECSAQDTCDAQGQCAPNHRATGTACAGQAGFCADGQCVSRQALGASCTLAAQCASGFCRSWYVDADADGHGDPNQQVSLCSPNPAEDRTASTGGAPIPILVVGAQRYSSIGDDCCDAAALVFPNQTNLFVEPNNACAGRVNPFDYNCDGVLEDQRAACGETCSGWRYVGQTPPCGGQGLLEVCTAGTNSCTEPALNQRSCR